MSHELAIVFDHRMESCRLLNGYFCFIINLSLTIKGTESKSGLTDLIVDLGWKRLMTLVTRN